MFPVYRVYDKSPFFEVFILHFLILSEMVPTPLAFRVINFKILHKLPSLQNVFSTKLLWSAPLHPACVQECCWEHWNLSPIHPVSPFNLLPILTGRSHRELSLSYKGQFTDTTSACQTSWEMVMQPFLNIIIKMRHIAWNEDFQKNPLEKVLAILDPFALPDISPAGSWCQKWRMVQQLSSMSYQPKQFILFSPVLFQHSYAGCFCWKMEVVLLENPPSCTALAPLSPHKIFWNFHAKTAFFQKN